MSAGSWHAHLVINQRAGHRLHVVVPEVTREVETLREHYVKQRDAYDRYVV